MNLLLICTVKTWTPLYPANTNNKKKDIYNSFQKYIQIPIKCRPIDIYFWEIPGENACSIVCPPNYGARPEWLNELITQQLIQNFHKYGVGSRPALEILKKNALDSQPQVIKLTGCLPMVGGSLRVLRLFSITKTGPHDRA